MGVDKVLPAPNGAWAAMRPLPRTTTSLRLASARALSEWNGRFTLVFFAAYTVRAAVLASAAMRVAGSAKSESGGWR